MIARYRDGELRAAPARRSAELAARCADAARRGRRPPSTGFDITGALETIWDSSAASTARRADASRGSSPRTRREADELDRRALRPRRRAARRRGRARRRTCRRRRAAILAALGQPAELAWEHVAYGATVAAIGIEAARAALPAHRRARPPRDRHARAPRCARGRRGRARASRARRASRGCHDRHRHRVVPRSARARRGARGRVRRRSESTRTRRRRTRPRASSELRDLLGAPAGGRGRRDGARLPLRRRPPRRAAPALRGAARARGGAPAAGRRPHPRGRRRHRASSWRATTARSSCTASRSPACSTRALERGWYFSFAGNVTYPKAAALREAAARGARRPDPRRDRQPVPRAAARARPAERARVRRATRVAALAEARGEDADELAARIDANATAAFALP